LKTGNLKGEPFKQGKEQTMNQAKKAVITRIEKALRNIDPSFYIEEGEIGDIGVDKDGKMDGYIYALGVGGKSRVSRKDVLKAIVEVLLEDGLPVYYGELGDYYVLEILDPQAVPGGLKLHHRYNNLYCNDFGRANRDSTIVFSDGLVEGETIYERDGKLFCRRRPAEEAKELKRVTNDLPRT
jgi:hypothetical protein